MLELIRKHWLAYIFEIIIAVIVFSFGLEAFLIYAFIMLLFKADMIIDYLRALTRVSQAANDIKQTAIIKKLKITDQEINKICDELQEKFSKEQWASFERDFKIVNKS